MALRVRPSFRLGVHDRAKCDIGLVSTVYRGQRSNFDSQRQATESTVYVALLWTEACMSVFVISTCIHTRYPFS